MSFRDELARIIASDPRFTIDGYGFVLEALDEARHQKLKAQGRDREEARSARLAKTSRPAPLRSKRRREAGHVTGGELCQAFRALALRQFGFLATTVLFQWGIHSTSDIGDIVYNLIDAGDLDKTPSDLRSDFDNIFDFDTALRPASLLQSDDPAS
jgi:uncharacterized repeat protein (TIGR04138 family)